MSLFILLQSLYPLMPFYSVGCLLATCMIHSFIYKDEMLESYLETQKAKRMAFRDALTGVKSKMAYLDTLKDPFYFEYCQWTVSNHPTAAGYSGAAQMVERLFSRAVRDNHSLFQTYNGVIRTVPVAYAPVT